MLLTCLSETEAKPNRYVVWIWKNRWEENIHQSPEAFFWLFRYFVFLPFFFTFIIIIPLIRVLCHLLPMIMLLRSFVSDERVNLSVPFDLEVPVSYL